MLMGLVVLEEMSALNLRSVIDDSEKQRRQPADSRGSSAGDRRVAEESGWERETGDREGGEVGEGRWCRRAAVEEEKATPVREGMREVGRVGQVALATAPAVHV